MSDSNSTLNKTLERLRILYKRYALVPGAFVKAGLKQGWNVVIGTEGQCGMAMSFAGREDVFGRQQLDLHKLQSFIGNSFFSVAAAYLESESWHERSIGVAAMTALSVVSVPPSPDTAGLTVVCPRHDRAFSAAHFSAIFAGKRIRNCAGRRVLLRCMEEAPE